MLSKHPDSCRFPHGHTRTIEVVVESQCLNSNGMAVDFKALKLALKDEINRFDHAMAINASDPLRDAMAEVYPESLIVFDEDPTTEVIAHHLFQVCSQILKNGYQSPDNRYTIEAGTVTLNRLRVWETPSSWAEVAQ